jgi:hypothetical protein
MATQYVISTGSATMVAATAKTLIELPTTSTMPLVAYKMEVTSGATAAGTLTFQWCSWVTTGTGTTITPLKWGVDQSVAMIAGTVKINDTVEPGTVAVLTTLLIPLPGMYSIIDPFGRETYQPISTNRCLRANSTLASPVAVNLYVEQ